MLGMGILYVDLHLVSWNPIRLNIYQVPSVIDKSHFETVAHGQPVSKIVVVRK